VVWEIGVVRRWRRWPGSLRVRLGLALAGAWLAVGLVVGVISTPYRVVQDELGFRRTTAEQTAWAARPTDYLAVSPRNRTYNRLLPTVWPEPLFPGFAVLALGGAGLAGLGGAVVRRRRRPGTISATDRPSGGAINASLVFYALLAGGAWMLSLGPVLDLGTVQVPLPYQALAALPGFSGLRSPVRLAVLAALGWGVLAGWAWLGLLALGRRLVQGSTDSRQSHLPGPGSRIVSAGLTLALLAVMAAEQWTVLTPTTPLPEGGATPPVYQWLAARPDRGVVAELPIAVGLRDPARTTLRMFYQGAHQHPLINGYSSFIPPTYSEIALALDHEVALTPGDIGILQSLEVRYLIFDRLAYKRSHWRQIMDSLPDYPPVQDVRQFGNEFNGSAAVTLAPLTDADHLRLDAALPSEAAAGATIPLTITLTNAYTYPLLTRLQPQLALAAEWEPVDGASVPAGASTSRSLIATPLTLDAGRHTFVTAIVVPGDRHTQPRRYRLRLGVIRPAPMYRLSAEPLVTIAP
jgi:MYXO-CTERM domain-containing protein